VLRFENVPHEPWYGKGGSADVQAPSPSARGSIAASLGATHPADSSTTLSRRNDQRRMREI
jgi:hypothetical protein